MDTATIYEEEDFGGHTYIFDDIPFAAITETTILQRCGAGFDNHPSYYKHISPQLIEINFGVFCHEYNAVNFPPVTVTQSNNQLSLTCGCNASYNRLCEHQTMVLTALVKKNDLRIFFDPRLRDEKLRSAAVDYGLEHETDLDLFFRVKYEGRETLITPRLQSLIPVTKESLSQYAGLVIPSESSLFNQQEADTDGIIFIVLKQHKYYKYLFIELYSSQTTKDGKIKNPLTLINPLDKIWGNR